MAFALKRKETVPEGIRRIAAERVEKALAAFDGRGSAPDETVHDARKRLKQVRGALRLVRSELGGKCFSQENRIFRDAARPLSEVRDAKVLLDTVDKLRQQYPDELSSDALKHLKTALQSRRRDIRKRVLGDPRTTGPIAGEMRTSLRRIADWPLSRKGWKALAAGLEQTYQKGQDAMGQALRDGSDEALHEWRKRTKDLRYAIDLLTHMWPETLEPWADQAHRLADLLGDDHDLAVLQGIVDHELQDLPDEERELLLPMTSRRRGELQKEAKELGGKLYAESANEFVTRIHRYWKQWR